MLNTVSIKKAFVQVNKTNRQVNSGHIEFFKNIFNLEVDEENKEFSDIFWNPKLNEYPYIARFIIAALEWSSKALSKAVTAALKLMCKRLEAYNSKSHYFSKVKLFWIVENKRDKGQSIGIFDFSTLSTNIAVNELKNMIRELTVSVLKVIYYNLLL